MRLEVNGTDVTLCVCLIVFLEKNTAFLGCIVAFFARDVPSEEGGSRDRSPRLSAPVLHAAESRLTAGSANALFPPPSDCL